MSPSNKSSLRLVLSLIITAVVLAGCGGVKGVYTHTENSPDGDGSMTMSLELKGGNVAVMTMKGGPSGGSASSTVEGTYKVEGDKVSITLQGDTESFTLAEGGLVGDFFGDKVVLKKQ